MSPSFFVLLPDSFPTPSTCHWLKTPSLETPALCKLLPFANSYPLKVQFPFNSVLENGISVSPETSGD